MLGLSNGPPVWVSMGNLTLRPKSLERLDIRDQGVYLIVG